MLMLALALALMIIINHHGDACPQHGNLAELMLAVSSKVVS